MQLTAANMLNFSFTQSHASFFDSAQRFPAARAQLARTSRLRARQVEYQDCGELFERVFAVIFSSSSFKLISNSVGFCVSIFQVWHEAKQGQAAREAHRALHALQPQGKPFCSLMFPGKIVLYRRRDFVCKLFGK